MNTRTRRFVAHFLMPFRPRGMDAILPAGAYALDQEEMLVAGRFGLVYRRVGMVMHLPTVTSGRWSLQPVSVDVSDIKTAILAEIEQPAGGSHAGHRQSG
jgi:hypothetical protein